MATGEVSMMVLVRRIKLKAIRIYYLCISLAIYITSGLCTCICDIAVFATLRLCCITAIKLMLKLSLRNLCECKTSIILTQICVYTSMLTCGVCTCVHLGFFVPCVNTGSRSCLYSFLLVATDLTLFPLITRLYASSRSCLFLIVTLATLEFLCSSASSCGMKCVLSVYNACSVGAFVCRPVTSKCNIFAASSVRVAGYIIMTSLLNNLYRLSRTAELTALEYETVCCTCRSKSILCTPRVLCFNYFSGVVSAHCTLLSLCFASLKLESGSSACSILKLLSEINEIHVVVKSVNYYLLLVIAVLALIYSLSSAINRASGLLCDFGNRRIFVSVKTNNLLISTNLTDTSLNCACNTACSLGVPNIIVLAGSSDLFYRATNLTVLLSGGSTCSFCVYLPVTNTAQTGNDVICKEIATGITLVYSITLLLTTGVMLAANNRRSLTVVLHVLFSRAGACCVSSKYRHCNRHAHYQNQNKSEHLLHCFFHCSSPLKN
ncbi:MAG: hypothetical protein IJY08_04170 [Clostridia bacterium]|nr:hypothetical protein [Clostridia bacterium]